MYIGHLYSLSQVIISPLQWMETIIQLAKFGSQATAMKREDVITD